jgi:hypothetical protein
MKVTRRQLAAVLAAAPVPLAAAPQAQAEDLDAAARDRVKNTAAALNAVEVPIATEPAVTFRVL